jgi:hypothetical protein
MGPHPLRNTRTSKRTTSVAVGQKRIMVFMSENSLESLDIFIVSDEGRKIKREYLYINNIYVNSLLENN